MRSDGRAGATVVPRNDAWVLRQGKAGQGTTHTPSLGRLEYRPAHRVVAPPAPWAPGSRQAGTHGTGRASSRTRKPPPWCTPGRTRPRRSRSTHSPHRCRRSRSRGRRPRRRAWGPPGGEAAVGLGQCWLPSWGRPSHRPEELRTPRSRHPGLRGADGAVQRRLATPGWAALSPSPSGPRGPQLEDSSPRPASLPLPLPGLGAAWLLGRCLCIITYINFCFSEVVFHEL